jgi:hypothetical protein
LDIPNAFIGRKEQPSPAEVAAALGPTAVLWNELVVWLADKQGIGTHEWRSFSPKYGWSLRVSVKQRNIAYLAPCDGCFRVGFVFGDRAVKAALQSGLPKKVTDALRAARKYAEGTGLTLIVKRSSDLPAIRRLTQIKLAAN